MGFILIFHRYSYYVPRGDCAVCIWVFLYIKFNAQSGALDLVYIDSRPPCINCVI